MIQIFRRSQPGAASTRALRCDNMESVDKRQAMEAHDHTCDETS